MDAAARPSPPRPPDPQGAGGLRYVALGDSLSEGVGDDPWPDGGPRGFTDRLAALLAAHHGSLEYANLAVRGRTARQVRDTQLADAVALAPDVVTLTAGMNDILRPRLDLDALRGTLVDIVVPFTARGVPVVVVPIPDVARVMPVARLFGARRLQLNAIYRELARRHGVLPPADTAGTVFEDPRAWADDRLHLSALGHQRLADAAACALGVPADGGWAAPPAGAAPPRTLRGEARWWAGHAGPWVHRRVRGRSSGDGRTAKRPVPGPFAVPS